MLLRSYWKLIMNVLQNVLMYTYIHDTKHIYIAHQFILLRFNRSNLWWFGGIAVLARCFIVAGLLFVLKSFTRADYLCFEDGIVWIWNFIVNLNIHSSPFYFVIAQSQYLVMIGRDGCLSILCHNYGPVLLVKKGC